MLTICISLPEFLDLEEWLKVMMLPQASLSLGLIALRRRKRPAEQRTKRPAPN